MVAIILYTESNGKDHIYQQIDPITPKTRIIGLEPGKPGISIRTGVYFGIPGQNRWKWGGIGGFRLHTGVYRFIGGGNT